MLRLGRPADVDSYRLAGTQADGPLLGYCAGQPIWEAIVDGLGRRYVFAGVAASRRDGRVDLSALRQGEWLLEPGLIYRSDVSARRWRWQVWRPTPA